ncbi:MAG: efflux RND transporter periplasmic adaptor subunit [Candidatus Korobacteraceae bacterium]|jgi:cobalt-zinc-cadmium efflux system membrane fusion protein
MIAKPGTGVVRSIPLLVFSVLLCSLAGCKQTGQSSGTMTSYSGNAGQPSDQAQLFKVPQEQLAHIQIVTIAPSSIPRSLRLTGAVAFNAFDTTPVITQIGGPVSRIVVTPGQQVRRDQPLLYVTSPDYSQALATYLKARDAFQLADRSYVRSKDLYQHHAIAERDLESAESARTQASADFGAAEQSLKILGISKPEAVVGKPAVSEIPVLSPIAGEVVERLVSPGQVIQGGATQVFTISNMSSVWVLANIFQKDLPYVHLGDSVTVTADSYAGTEFHGKISYIAAALDANTRTLQARIDVKNPQGQLKKDMYVFATVQAETIQNALTVPAAAVLRDAENQPFVYVVNQNNEYGRRSVTLGVSAEGNTQIVSGVTAGDRVVGDGSVFLQFANSVQR